MRSASADVADSSTITTRVPSAPRPASRTASARFSANRRARTCILTGARPRLFVDLSSSVRLFGGEPTATLNPPKLEPPPVVVFPCVRRTRRDVEPSLSSPSRTRFSCPPRPPRTRPPGRGPGLPPPPPAPTAEPPSPPPSRRSSWSTRLTDASSRPRRGSPRRPTRRNTRSRGRRHRRGPSTAFAVSPPRAPPRSPSGFGKADDDDVGAFAHRGSHDGVDQFARGRRRHDGDGPRRRSADAHRDARASRAVVDAERGDHAPRGSQRLELIVEELPVRAPAAPG